MSQTIPNKDSDFDKYVDLLDKMLIDHAAAWGMDLAYVNDHFKPLRSKWKATYAKYSSPLTCTEAIIHEKQMLRKELEAVARKIIAMIRANVNVTQDQLDTLNISTNHGSKEVTPAPKKSPNPKQLPSEDGIISLCVLNRETNKRGKPRGAEGYFVVFEVADEAPKSKDGYTNRVYISGGDFSYKFPEELRGKRVQIRVFWVNTVGKESPWSPVLVIIIP